jgi:hypothetical protein
MPQTVAETLAKILANRGFAGGDLQIIVCRSVTDEKSGHFR